jgi:hypothetical protein
VGKEHLRLFSEHSAQGMQASVYNVTAKSWIAPSEPVEDIEQGKERAEDRPWRKASAEGGETDHEGEALALKREVRR